MAQMTQARRLGLFIITTYCKRCGDTMSRALIALDPFPSIRRTHRCRWAFEILSVTQ